MHCLTAPSCTSLLPHPPPPRTHLAAAGCWSFVESRAACTEPLARLEGDPWSWLRGGVGRRFCPSHYPEPPARLGGMGALC